MKIHSEAQRRSSYETPRLERFGTFRELTRMTFDPESPIPVCPLPQERS